jgi:hypothetical protein
MRQVKLFTTAVFILIAFLSLVTIFLPCKVTVSKTIFINAKDSAVRAQIADIKNWKNWYPAFQNKNMTIIQSIRNDTVFGELITENQNKLQVAIVIPQQGTINIYFPDIKKQKENFQFLVVAGSTGKTNLTLNVNSDLGWYPWKKLVGIFLDKITGPEYEAALKNIKKAAENVNP